MHEVAATSEAAYENDVTYVVTIILLRGVSVKEAEEWARVFP
ncbi:unnamed protein product [marine sediment metagenome]|uniref:Uncharacterized protein n=1 Tax=marine sediment metagenome TaxID=412755 RepID=X0VWK9_9ZZZZ